MCQWEGRAGALRVYPATMELPGHDLPLFFGAHAGLPSRTVVRGFVRGPVNGIRLPTKHEDYQGMLRSASESLTSTAKSLHIFSRASVLCR
jgi:hypothetical protein